MELANAVYSCKWYELKPKDICDLIFIMKRAQNQLKLTAGKLFTLSLNFYTHVRTFDVYIYREIKVKIGIKKKHFSSKILETSLGYLTLLLTLKRKQASSLSSEEYFEQQ